MDVESRFFQRVKSFMERHLTGRNQDEGEKRRADLRQQLDYHKLGKLADATEAQVEMIFAALGLPQPGPHGAEVYAMLEAAQGVNPVFIRLQAVFDNIRAGIGQGATLGKTTQQLLLCLEMMSGPQTVNYLWPDGNTQYPHRLFQQLLTNYGIANSSHFGASTGSYIMLPDTGAKIVFRSILTCSPRTLMGAEWNQSWVLDHACHALASPHAYPILRLLEQRAITRPRPY